MAHDGPRAYEKSYGQAWLCCKTLHYVERCYKDVERGLETLWYIHTVTCTLYTLPLIANEKGVFGNTSSWLKQIDNVHPNIAQNFQGKNSQSLLNI